MRKFLPALLLVLLPGLASSDMIDDIKALRAYQLADAYYQVGSRYVEVGNKDVGDAYKAEALRIFPGYLDPAKRPKAPENPQPTPVTDPTPVSNPRDLSQVKAQAIKGDKIVKIQFSKLLRAFINKDVDGIGSVLGAQLLVAGETKPLTRDEVLAKTTAFFQANDTTQYSPYQILKMDSLTIKPVADSQDYQLSVEAGEGVDLSSILPFWKSPMTFLFQRDGDLWKLAAVQN